MVGAGETTIIIGLILGLGAWATLTIPTCTVGLALTLMGMARIGCGR